MNVSDLMTRSVVCIGPDATVTDAVACLDRHHVAAMPVVDRNGRLVGMLTEGDLLRRVAMEGEATTPQRRRWLDRLGLGAVGGNGVRGRARRVGDVMTADVVTVPAWAPLGEVVRLMEAHAIRRLPVVDAGRVVGIVSRSDLVADLAAWLAERRTFDGETLGGVVDA